MLRATHVRVSFITLAAVATATLFTMLTPRAVAARPDASKVKDIKTFIECINMIKGKKRSLHHAVRCIPPCCNFVVTMSRESAQRACLLAGCKLPRVIFDCPGPAADRRFRPSFLLCPTDSKSDDQFGTDRVEIGEDVDSMGTMKMADVPAPPGATNFKKVTEVGVLSKATNDDFGTKGCNEGCHDAPAPPADADGNQLSKPIDPFGKFRGTDLAPFIIGTDEPGHAANPAMAMSLKDICKCIRQNRDKIKQAANDPSVAPEDRNPTLDAKLLLKLCNKLKRKIPRTPCGTPRNTWTPTPTEMPPSQTPSKTPNDTPTDTPPPMVTATQTATATRTATDTPGATATPPATTTATASAASTTTASP